MGFSLSSLILGGIQLIAGLFLTATGIGSGVGIKLILSGGLTLISQLMGGPGRSGFETSPRYGFDNLQNFSTEGMPVPVIYGEEQVAPIIISANIKMEGGEQTLYVLGLLGEGPIESVSDVRLNDTPAEVFGLRFSQLFGTDNGMLVLRKGEATQTAIPGFDQIGTPYEANTKLDLAATHTHVVHGEVNGVRLALTWYGGIWRINSEGDMRPDSAWISIMVKRSGADDATYAPYLPTTAPPGWVKQSAGVFSFEGNTRSTVRSVFPIEFASKGEWTVRIKGERADDERHVVAPTITSIIEVVNDTRTYPNRALLALKIPASAQLSGGIPRITCIVRGRTLYDPRTGNTAWSRNPFLVLRDLLLNTRYGLGQWLTATDLDEGVASSWRNAMDACDAQLTPPGASSEATFQTDLVVDTKAPAREWISQILSSCRGTMFSADGKLRVWQDLAKASSRTFSEDEGDGQRKNIVAAEGEVAISSLADEVIPHPEQWTRVRMRHTDRAEAFKSRTSEAINRRVSISSVTGTFVQGEGFAGRSGSTVARGVVAKDADSSDSHLYYLPFGDDVDLGTWSGIQIKGETSGATATVGNPEELAPERLLEVQLYGVTRKTQALREARYLLNQAMYAPRLASWAVFLGDLDLTPGDVVAIDSARLGWSGKLWRIISISYDHHGVGRIHAREYSASVYTVNVERPPTRVTPPSQTPNHNKDKNNDAGASTGEDNSSSGTGSNHSNTQGTSTTTSSPTAPSPPPAGQGQGAATNTQTNQGGSGWSQNRGGRNKR